LDFIVYCHEIMAGSEVGLHFAPTLEQSKSDLEAYKAAFLGMNPEGEPLGHLAIYEIVLRIPDIGLMIDILNSPPSVFAMCLKSKRLVA